MLEKTCKKRGTVKVVDLVNSRKILEQRRDLVRVMKKRMMLDPVREKFEMMIENIEK